MEKTKTLAVVAICLSTLMAVIFCISNICSVFENCPKCATKCMKYKKCAWNAEKPSRCNKFKMQKGNRDFRQNKFRQQNAKQFRRPQFKMTEEQKAQMKVFFETVKAYKKEQTPENKAKLVELLGKNFDKRIAAQEKRAAALKKTSEDLAKKNAEMKANRDAEIEKMLQNIMNPKKRQMRRNFKKADKPAAAAAN